MEARLSLWWSLAILFLGQLYGGDCLCDLQNGTVARCHELDDVKYIDTYNLETLRTTVDGSVLRNDLFGKLASLRHLDLSGGELQKVEPGSFHELEQLKSLDLSDNALTYLDLGSLNGLHHLHSLNLRRNRLTQLPPALMRLKSLRHLDIQGNPFECNCATLRVRDVLVKRGIKLSKKVICLGPGNMKGTSLLKHDTEMICTLEEQDKEMQNDEAVEETDDLGSGQSIDDLFLEENKDEDLEETPVTVEVSSPSTEEIETPAPEENDDASSTTTLASQVSTNKSTDEEIEVFHDSGEQNLTKENSEKIRDGLFYPAEEGSGDEEEGSGTEGSGTGIEWTKKDEPEDLGNVTKATSTTTEAEGLIDMIWGAFWGSTNTPEENKETSIEEEEFIDVSTHENDPAAPAEEIVPTIVHHDLESTPDKPSNPNTVSLDKSDSSVIDAPKDSGKEKAAVKAEDDLDDVAEVSPTIQSKKGMGSYVVLAALLAILAGLIGFAAYKGDFCRKKRKREDVESGTEMKDMQKALLETGNNAQPKISSNGNAESAPLMGQHRQADDSKMPDGYGKRNSNAIESPKYSNGTTGGGENGGDPVKPPRKISPQEEVAKVHDSPQQQDKISPNDRPSSLHSNDDPLPVLRNPIKPIDSATTEDLLPPCDNNQRPNGPPLSPGAQRVKITLQENPDSVPKTPILITRTLAGENLVKTP